MKKKRNSVIYKSYRSLVQAKRFVLNRRGDGVHSPYAFHLITKVIRNPYPYDCFRFLEPKHKELSKSLKDRFGDRAIYRIKRAELVFRLAFFHSAKKCLLLSHKSSLILPYLRATNKFDILEHLAIEDDEAKGVKISEDIGLIIIEDILEAKLSEHLALLEPIIEAQKNENLMIIVNSNNPVLRKHKKLLTSILKPTAYFSLKGLEVFVWRKSLTKGIYKVYSKG